MKESNDASLRELRNFETFRSECSESQKHFVKNSCASQLFVHSKMNFVKKIKFIAGLSCESSQLDVLSKMQLRAVLSVLIKVYSSLFRMCKFMSMS